MTRIQDLQQYPSLNGGELIPCLQFGQAEDGFIISADLVNFPTPAATISATSYVFTGGDEKRIIEFTASSSVICGIPADASFDFADGTVLRWVQLGVGRVFFGSGSGTTVRWPKDSSDADCKIARKINSGGTFRKRGTNDWHAMGDLSAT